MRLVRLLQTRKRSAQRIAIARRFRAAVALAYPAMGTDCGLLRRFADAPRSTRLPNARLSALVSPGQAQFGDCLRSPARVQLDEPEQVARLILAMPKEGSKQCL